jgi:hypothetical protein
MFVYDYYTVSIPGDMFIGDSSEDQLKQMAQQAITEAKERTKLYSLPSEWTATLVSGEPGDFEVVFKVRRKRSKSS